MNERNKTRRRTSKKKRWSAKRKIIISTIAVFALIIGILAYGYLYIKSKIYSEISIPNNIEDTEYTDKVIVHILAEVTVADEIEKEAIEASNGKITVEKSEEGIYFKEDNRLYKIL